MCNYYYYAISHGASLEYPIIVSPVIAKWLKEGGVIVLTYIEYLQRIDKKLTKN